MAKHENPGELAAQLRKAFKGSWGSWGVDDKALIHVLAGLDSETILEVRQSYEKQFDRDLLKDIHADTSGHFGELLDLVVLGPVERDAFLLWQSMKGIGTNDAELIEVLISRPTDHIRKVREYFATKYEGSLDEWISGDTSGHYREFLLRLATAERVKSNVPVDAAQVASDVKALYRSGEGKIGTNEEAFIDFFATRSPKHVRKVAEEYAKEYAHSLETAVKKEFSGDLEKALVWCLEFFEDHYIFFAKRIHHSIKGVGTKDKDVVRIIASRREVDLSEIADAYNKVFGKSLKEALHDDTSGDFQKLLLEIIKDA